MNGHFGHYIPEVLTGKSEIIEGKILSEDEWFIINVDQGIHSWKEWANAKFGVSYDVGENSS